jgi:hypothetical protein
VRDVNLPDVNLPDVALPNGRHPVALLQLAGGWGTFGTVRQFRFDGRRARRRTFDSETNGTMSKRNSFKEHA